jgi:hypothetical protein
MRPQDAPSLLSAWICGASPRSARATRRRREWHGRQQKVQRIGSDHQNLQPGEMPTRPCLLCIRMPKLAQHATADAQSCTTRHLLLFVDVASCCSCASPVCTRHSPHWQATAWVCCLSAVFLVGHETSRLQRPPISALCSLLQPTTTGCGDRLGDRFNGCKDEKRPCGLRCWRFRPGLSLQTQASIRRGRVREGASSMRGALVVLALGCYGQSVHIVAARREPPR